MKTALLILIVLAAALVLFIRFQPPNAEAAHVDPRDLPDPGQGGVRRVGVDAPVYEAAPDAVLAALIEIAEAAPRTELLAGSASEGMVTVLTRTPAMSFQDYVTALAEPTGKGTRLHIAARTRYAGASDWGMNRARLEEWLAQLAARLGEAGG